MAQINTAVILVAGLGSRLKPLTDEVLKCLTEVNGKPILEQTLEALVRNGISKAVIVVGYLARPGNYEDLTAGIDKILHDKTWLRMMKKRCRQVALDRFALHVQARRYEELFRQMIDERVEC